MSLSPSANAGHWGVKSNHMSYVVLNLCGLTDWNSYQSSVRKAKLNLQLTSAKKKKKELWEMS